jgi:hypothetical protein
MFVVQLLTHFLYNSNNFFFKLTIGSVFLHVSPTYPTVDFKKQLLKLYKNDTKVIITSLWD